jgi:hypothetical protein
MEPSDGQSASSVGTSECDWANKNKIVRMIDEAKVGKTYMAMVRIVNVRVDPTFKDRPEGCGLGRPSFDGFAEQNVEEAVKKKRWSPRIHPPE